MTKISNQYSLTNILTADLANSRLGINNVSPTVALDVTGAGKFSSSVTSDDLLLTAGTLFSAGNTGFSNRLSDTTLYLQMPATGFTITDNALNTKFNITSAGAATFSSSLTVNGFINLGSSAVFPTVGLLNRTSDTTLYLKAAASGFTLLDSSQNGMYQATSTSHIWSISNSEKMRITSAGLVGIGATTPTAKLQVEGYGTANSIMTYVCAKFYGFGSGGVNIGTDGTNPQIATDSSGADLTFLTRVSGVFYERMRITSGGNVGIFTTGPNCKLEVHNGTGNLITTQFYNYAGDQTASTLITRSGREQSGNLYSHIEAFQNTNTRAFRVLANGTCENATGSYGSLSDIKLKENIQPATLKLNDLLKVNIVNYNFINDSNKEKQIGIIAQELETIFPNMIYETNDYEDIEIEEKDENGKIIKKIERKYLDTKTKSVKYSIFIPMLIKAIQELSAKVSLLENK